MLGILLVSFAQGTIAHAQSPADSGLARVLRESRAQFHFVRVVGTDTIQGRVASVDADRVRLVAGSMRLSDIRMVEMRIRSGGGGGIGALLGMVTVAGIGHLLASRSNGIGLNGAVGIGMVSVAFGAPLGYLAGRAVDPPEDSWSYIWARPSGSPRTSESMRRLHHTGLAAALVALAGCSTAPAKDASQHDTKEPMEMEVEAAAKLGLPTRLSPVDVDSPNYRPLRNRCVAQVVDAEEPEARLSLESQYRRRDRWQRADTTFSAQYAEGVYRVTPAGLYGLEPDERLRVNCARYAATAVVSQVEPVE